MTNVDGDTTPFHFTFANPTTDQSTTDDNHTGALNADVGSHVVTETPVAGYTTIGWKIINGGDACGAAPTGSNAQNGGLPGDSGLDNTAEVSVTGNNTRVICFYNSKDPVPQHITFTKYLCDSYTDVPANPGGGPDDTGKPGDTTGGHTLGAAQGASCTLADNWTFELYDRNPETSSGDVDNGTGFIRSVTDGDVELTPAEFALAQQSSLWVRERYVGGNSYGFGEIACTGDTLNHDNAEFLHIAESGTEGITCTAWNVRLRHVTIKKIVDNVTNDPTEFGFTVDGSTVGSASEIDPGIGPMVVDAGDHMIVEPLPLPAGYEFVSAEDCTPAAAPEGVEVADPNSYLLEAGTSDVVVCFHNKRSTGHITVNKVVIGQDGITETGKFNLRINGVTYKSDAMDGDTTGAVELLTGDYTIDETAGTGTNLSDYSASISCTDNGAGILPPTVTLVADHNIVCTITNRRNPVLATPSITVEKFSDPLGNFTGTGGRLGNWPITITGVSGLAVGHTYTQNTGNDLIGDPANFGVAHFDGIEEGTYSVQEPSATVGYVVVGSTLNGVAQDADYIRDGADVVTAFHGTNPVVRFYNRPFVNIHVTKTEVTDNVGAPGAGWAITVVGCGHTYGPANTDASGIVDFNDLPPCASYTVSENANSKSGFAPAGGVISHVVSATVAGQTYPVTFTNNHLTPGCVSNCGNNVPTPTPSPSPSPTATPTTPGETPSPTVVPPTNTPTTGPTDVVLGEKTPGPGASATPLAPSTGSGFFGTSGGSTNILLALFGLLALSGGLATLAFSHRKSRN